MQLRLALQQNIDIFQADPAVASGHQDTVLFAQLNTRISRRLRLNQYFLIQPVMINQHFFAVQLVYLCDTEDLPKVEFRQVQHLRLEAGILQPQNSS
ncbi:hypothetical protein D3C79_1029370 [compost metagenome]